VFSLSSTVLLPAAGKDVVRFSDWSKLLLALLALSGARGHPNVFIEIYEGYVPVRVKCPEDVQWRRPAEGIEPSEADWVHGRKPVVVEALSSYLERIGMHDFDVPAYI